MPDVFINSISYQHSSLFKLIKCFFVSVIVGFSFHDHQDHAGHNQVCGDCKKGPGQDLMERCGIFKPEWIICGNKPDDAFPGKTSVKTVTLSVKQCPPGNNNYGDIEDHKYQNPCHKRILYITDTYYPISLTPDDMLLYGTHAESVKLQTML